MSEIPFDRVTWSVEQVADYMGIAPKTLRNKLKNLHGFPHPVPGSEYGQARWRAIDVSDWWLGRTTPSLPLRVQRGSKKPAKPTSYEPFSGAG